MYTIALLPSKQFNKLPYNDVDISMGIADYKKGKAYVRKSGIPAMDMLVAGHELQELLATVSPHEENGIRYKKGGAARSIVPMVLGALATVLTGGGAAPLLGATMASLLGAGVGAASGAGMGAYAQSNHPELGAGAPIMGAIGGGLGGFGLGQAGLGAAAGWGNAAGQSLLSKTGAALQGGVMGTGTASTAMGNVPVAYTSGAGAQLGLMGAVNQAGSSLSNLSKLLPYGGTPLGQSAYGNIAVSGAQSMLNPAKNTTQMPNYQIIPYNSNPDIYNQNSQNNQNNSETGGGWSSTMPNYLTSNLVNPLYQPYQPLRTNLDYTSSFLPQTDFSNSSDTNVDQYNPASKKFINQKPLYGWY